MGVKAAAQLVLVLALSILPLCHSSVRVRSRARLRGKVSEIEYPSAQETRVSLDVPFSRCLHVLWDDKLVVAARYEEDVSWMAAYLAPWMPFLVYSISGDQAATHRTLSNTGREAQAYLQFVVDYYDCLPQEIAFIHAHRSSGHSPDMLTELKRLRWGSIPGFLSISRPQRNSTFFFREPQRQRPAPDDTSERAHWSEFAFQQNQHISAAWPSLFEAELGSLPEELTSPCCGQFAVSRQRVLAHPKSFYQDALRWLQVSEMDSFWAGLIFEHTWAMVFGAGPRYLHPDECTVFACDPAGKPVTPPWETLVSPRPTALQQRQAACGGS